MAKNALTLRDYQQECVDVINALPDGSRVIVSLATGLGKTVVAAHIARKGRMLILSHRDELVRQPEKYFPASVSYGVEKGKEYSVDEFLDNLYSSSAVALKNARTMQTLNLAMSNALRLMHDNQEIILKKNPDSAKTWHLFPNEEHEFTSDFTHIMIKKAVK